MSSDFSTATLPPPPATLFFVGIGGIGMSALAQFLRWQGYTVAGSDRELTGPGRDELYGKLRTQGITVWPQDGSGVRDTQPGLLIYSTAVEEGNPDFSAGAAIPRMHRAQALAAGLNRTPGRQIGIAGSCGKTSVTGWIAAALQDLGQPVCAVCGGYMNNFITPTLPGNFYADKISETAMVPWLVYEVDESDGSLVSFRPEIGVVLNIGTDHYDHAKLLELFSTYLGHCRQAGVIQNDLAAELTLPPALPLSRFAACANVALSGPGSAAAPGPKSAAIIRPTHYQAAAEGISFTINFSGPGTAAEPGPEKLVRFTVPQYGRHSVTNAAAVVATLQAAGVPFAAEAWRNAVAAFRGVARRFDHAGTTRRGIAIFDDYAHNVEKICAAIAAAQELSGTGSAAVPVPKNSSFFDANFQAEKISPEMMAPAAAVSGVLIIFQPHGYGPFKFMREPLREALRGQLRPQDTFAFLPVFYAGGTSSFSPTAEEVCAEYAAAGLRVKNFAAKSEAEAFVAAGAEGARTVLVLGARDPALPHWCATLAAL